MDPSLLKDYNAFKKRSLATPAVEKKRSRESNHGDIKKPKVKRRKQELPAQLLQQSKKQAIAQTYKPHTQMKSKSRFAILSSIVDLLKKKYQQREFDGFTLDQLLDITNNTDIKPQDKEWLELEALKVNPKISFRDGKYYFKPKYALRDRKSLVRLLEKHDQTGLGGIMLDDVREGLPNADDAIKVVRDRLTFVTRSTDKKAILFCYDHSYTTIVDEEFQKHWRSVSVEGLAEADIERYLNLSGITSMQGVVPVNQKVKEKKRSQKKRSQKNLSNNHLIGTVLKDYSEIDGKSK